MNTSISLLSIIILSFFSVPLPLQAHVRYFNESNSGIDFNYFLSPLLNISNIVIIVLTILICSGVYVYYSRNEFLKSISQKITERSASYLQLIAWMIRLPLGIALIGFGSAHVLLSPVLPTTELFALLQIATGFFILLGFMNTLASVIVIFLYVIALFSNPFLIGSLDIASLALALIIIDARYPGVDHLLGIKDIVVERFIPYLHSIVRIGLGSGLLYLAFDEKILNPHMAATVVVETGLLSVIPVSVAMWVMSAGLVEALIGILLIIGIIPRLVSAITFIVLSLSFFYFKEDVYSHVTLFGSLAVIFVTAPYRMKIRDILFSKFR